VSTALLLLLLLLLLLVMAAVCWALLLVWQCPVAGL
jgi:hypothetical protein